MKRVWSFSPDQDGDRPYYGALVAETRDEAAEKFEKILGRLLGYGDHLTDDGVMETDEEIDAEAREAAKGRETQARREKAEKEKRETEWRVNDALDLVRRKMLSGGSQ